MYDSFHAELGKVMPGTQWAQDRDTKRERVNDGTRERAWESIVRAGEGTSPLRMCHEESMQSPRGAGRRPGKNSYRIAVRSAVQIPDRMLALKMRVMTELDQSVLPTSKSSNDRLMD